MRSNCVVKRILSILAIFAVVSCCAGDENADREAKFASFKQKLMPHVGKEFTASGHFQAGKFGWWISFDGWGAYIESKNTNSLPRLNALGRFRDKEVTVKGMLHLQPERRSTNTMAAGIPEHFYFDAGKCEVIEKSESMKDLPKQNVKLGKPASGSSTNAQPK